MPTPQQILQQHWGHKEFRPLQEEIIQSVLEGKDTLAVLPTGGGKSVCFQVPALLKEGLCLVISPLIALMKDQVENLLKRNIPALCIQSGMTFFEVKDTLKNASFGSFKFLYVSPERLETALFKEYIGSLPLNIIAIDEAHCISQWGYDFRPPYLRIAAIREHYPGVPVLALTASATPIVQEDICEKLLFKTKNIYRQSFAKPNLSFSVFKVDSKINKLVEVLQKVPGPALVYCSNRKHTKEIAHLLQLSNLAANFYHAGLSQAERSHRQEAFIKNQVRIMVCTNAFGMGIDKPDVRTVIHMDVPDNLENYYQEAGRAGRDGKQSFAVLLHSTGDLNAIEKLPDVKYPSLQEIKSMYQSLANYLQVPVGSGESLYYNFSLYDFVKNFKLNSLVVVNAFKALEQQGHLLFNDQVFITPKVGFTCDKNVLQNFEEGHPAFDNLIKYLLRTYEGIFDNVVSINEKLLTRLTKLSLDELQTQLDQLQAFGILEYQPQIETPQIFFLQNRAPAQYMTFNLEQHETLKKHYRQRVHAMLQYAQLENACRSQFMGNYFGDDQMLPCGQCDNCLRNKKIKLSEEEFSAISQRIYIALDNQSINVKELFNQLNGLKRDNIWKVLDHLQMEKKILVSNEGMLSKK
ncbi:MAG: RecQ family ATP-dependent DNA helicase [Chitinophagaceae bacterium]|nr:RecQ family ATP-dependent DNA helicase [Chitinophagaceae bacterium]